MALTWCMHQKKKKKGKTQIKIRKRINIATPSCIFEISIVPFFFSLVFKFASTGIKKG